MQQPTAPQTPSLSLSSGTIRLLRRRIPEHVPVTPQSIALFRLGEACNHACPMCSNSGRPEAFFIQQDELLRRVAFLHSQGLRRVVLTGGEPTIHPAFWPVVAALQARGMVWDINSNGSRFADGVFAARAVEEGLQRAIISLHALDEAKSCLISGIKPKGHAEILAALDNLLTAGVPLLINCVLTTHTAADALGFVQGVRERWGPAAAVKLCFPSTAGKGGAWEGLQLRYHDVQEQLRAVHEWAQAVGHDVVFESVPPCILGDASIRDVSRSGFGESHYLDDVHGDRLYAIAHIEAQFSALPETCKTCRAFARCPGPAERYLRQHGAAEFVPL